jgi:molybdenum transport protein
MRMTVLPTAELEKLLADDAPYGDLTTEALGIGAAPASISFAARQKMVVSAIEDAAALLQLAGVAVETFVASGDQVEPGALLLKGEGPAAGVHRVWKVGQTLVEIWSGVATATRALVLAARAEKRDVAIACTRKNVPGTKALAAAAVKAGGAAMHRLGLSETILVFPEDRAFRRDSDVAALLRELRAKVPEKKLVIEVTSTTEACAAAMAGFDVIQGREVHARADRPVDGRAVGYEATPASRRSRRHYVRQRSGLRESRCRHSRHVVPLHRAPFRRARDNRTPLMRRTYFSLTHGTYLSSSIRKRPELGQKSCGSESA